MKKGKFMKSKIVIGIMTFVWLALMANIIWQGTDGKGYVEDAEKIGQLEVAKYTNQVVVVAVSDEGTRLCFYERDAEYDTALEKEMINNKWNMENMSGNEDGNRAMNEDKNKKENIEWKLMLETEALIGRNGLGKTKEGDGKTPRGVYRFTEAFGILENPGAQMEYVQVKKSHYWVDDGKSNYYNQFIDGNEVEMDWDSAEQICEFGEAYHYVLAINYNEGCIPGMGSAVFLHCTTENMESTAGCVAIPEFYMKQLVMQVEPQCVLIIDTADCILKY